MVCPLAQVRYAAASSEPQHEKSDAGVLPGISALEVPRPRPIASFAIHRNSLHAHPSPYAPSTITAQRHVGNGMLKANGLVSEAEQFCVRAQTCNVALQGVCQCPKRCSTQGFRVWGLYGGRMRLADLKDLRLKRTLPAVLIKIVWCMHVIIISLTTHRTTDCVGI